MHCYILHCLSFLNLHTLRPSVYPNLNKTCLFALHSVIHHSFCTQSHSNPAAKLESASKHEFLLVAGKRGKKKWPTFELVWRWRRKRGVLWCHDSVKQLSETDVKFSVLCASLYVSLNTRKLSQLDPSFDGSGRGGACLAQWSHPHCLAFRSLRII